MLSRRLINIKSSRRFSDLFTTGANSHYIQTMYDSWKQDPKSVHISWQAYFSGLDIKVQTPFSNNPPTPISQLPQQQTLPASSKWSQKANVLMRAYQCYGYILAELDPLNLQKQAQSHGNKQRIPGLIRLQLYKIGPQDMQRQVDIGSDLLKGFSDINGPKRGLYQIQELIDACTKVYCGKMGFEYMHIPFRDQCNWMRERIEKIPQFMNTSEQKLYLYERLTRGHILEEFLHKKFTTHKRFGMDGLQGVIVALDSIINRAVANGVQNFVIGMPHRGRLSVMAQILGFQLTEMFSLFFGLGHRFVEEGDVKYHLGTQTEREINGKKVKLTLLANPSHLEAVDPVALGYTRAIQNASEVREKSLTILLHGDAALAGQGVVYETLQLQDLYDYGTGGCVHIVMNNNIGFTTTPRQGRAQMFPTDIAKVIEAPIMHVNSECPEQIDFVSKLAFDWRKEFKKSVFIDIIGYRRYGHNQLDEPLFTNPLMYQLINKRTPSYNLYAERLLNQGVITQRQIADIRKTINNQYESVFSSSKKKAEIQQSDYTRNFLEWRKGRTLLSDPQNTGLPIQRLREIGLAVNFLPQDIHAHPQIRKIYKNRAAAIQRGTGIDWATGESLAWATLVTQNKMEVRISGQDVQRGTFSQRHSVVHDQKQDMKKYIPLNNIESGQALFTTLNSNLSEFGVLGFQYGYSLANPNTLTMWEAQFGDFANGAQIMIDQFITSGEAKWGQESGIVLLLPHGYDGQGAEHSCARPGRFLQLASQDLDLSLLEKIAQKKQSHYTNFQLVDPTTPANYFHMLRRQVLREFRKPLIVISPKKLLRHRNAVSNLEDFAEGTVIRMYDDQSEIEYPEKIRKVIMCTGQVYYDLVEERRRRGIKDIAITRMEQITPFPYDGVLEIGKKYFNARFEWVQEEPKNLGAYKYVEDRINLVLNGMGNERISVVSRPVSATAATGYATVHTAELLDLMDQAMA